MYLRRALKFLPLILVLFLISCGENKCAYLGDKSKFQGIPQVYSVPSWLQNLPKILADQLSDKLFGVPDPNITTKGLIGSRMMIADNKQTVYKQDDPSTHLDANFKDVDKNRGTVYSMYAGIVRSTEYRAIYYLGLTLYVVIVGLMYLLGMTEMTLQKSMPLLIKIGVISLFTNPTLSGATGMPIGWSVYYSAIVAPAVYGMEAFAMYFASVLFNLDINQVENGFIPITVMLTFIFNDVFWIKMTTLIFSTAPMGFATFVIILIAMVTYIISGVLSIFSYLVIISTLGILFAIGPIFFLFLLFEKTKLYFDKWWKQILALMLQQYSLFVAISVFGYIILKCAQAIMSFGVKCTTVISLKLLSFIEIPIFYYYTVNLGPSGALTLAMYAVFFWMLTAIYATTIQKVAELGAGLVTGASAVGGGTIGMTATAWEATSGVMKGLGSSFVENAYQSPEKFVKSGIGAYKTVSTGDVKGAIWSTLTSPAAPFRKPKTSLERLAGYKEMFAPTPPAPSSTSTPPLSPTSTTPKTQSDNSAAPKAPSSPTTANTDGKTYTDPSGASANFNPNAYVVDNGNRTSMVDYLSKNPNINLNDAVPENLKFSGSERVGNGSSYTYADMLNASQPPPAAGVAEPSANIAPSYT